MCAKPISVIAQNQIDNSDIHVSFIFKINNVDWSDYLLQWNLSFDKAFGSSSGVFELDNNDARFSNGGANEVKVGDVIELIEIFEGDTAQWKRFYGLVEQRSIEKSATTKVIRLNCLDYISSLKTLNLDLVVDGTLVEIENEVLTPNYLEEPNENLAQLYDFANNSVATAPLPIIRIRDKNHQDNVDTQFDGFEIYYGVGQLKLGAPLNAKYNYDVLATYFHYTKGRYAEDIIEQILIQPTGYDGYLFGEPTEQTLIDNHLTESYLNAQGTTIDNLSPNAASVTLTLETTLTADVEASASTIYVEDTAGFPEPESGETIQASINGDIFTYTGIESGNTLTGIPISGSYSLSAHSSGDYVSYEAIYETGKVWYLSYSNLVTSLTGSDFTLPSGVTLTYHNKRGTQTGSYIILSDAVSVTEIITCTTNYLFKTLQATGIEINRMSFREREVANRLDAIKKVREYLPPNYIIRTIGDDKIYGGYLQQKDVADYDLKLMTSVNYLEDEDIFTRVLTWGKNKQPTNIMFGDDVDYTSDTEDEYSGIATKTELQYLGEEKSGALSSWANSQLSNIELISESILGQMIQDVQAKYINKDYTHQDPTGYHVFVTPITERGKIILDTVTPTVFINDVPIDNKTHRMVAVPVKVKTTTKTITEGGGKSKSVSVSTYYYYSVFFPHTALVPGEELYLYDNQGNLQYTLSPNDPNMDYSTGVWNIPGSERNDVAEILSTATYYVLYSSDALVIDYDNVAFKIDKSILPNPEEAVVRATFEYWAIALAIRDIDTVVDGRRDTQLQLEFFGEPAAGFHLATIDLGSIYNVQAVDIVGGFFKPDDFRKFDVGFRLSMQYSENGTDFFSISDATENISVSGGEAISFEEDDLGSGFEARYLKFSLQSVDRINYGRGRYVVALTEISVYSDIVIRSETTLIPTTATAQEIFPGDTVVYLDSTSGFTDPAGSEATAYIGTTAFTYTGIDSGNALVGCDLDSGFTAAGGTRVSQTLEGDNSLYDDDGLLPQLGDRVFKLIKISERNLFVQSELDALSKSYLKEFYKNHNKRNVDILFTPYLQIGQTVSLTDAYNNETDVKYFIESISNSSGVYSIVIAKYP